MSRVRKDILNGWKEIGGYVCRDIRTVERWEKSRGLPVRRVPGAGRATVYALIPEVDEWLASAKIDETDDPSASESYPATEEHSRAASPAMADHTQRGAHAAATRAFENAAKHRTEAEAKQLEVDPLPNGLIGAARSRRLIAGVTVAVAVALLAAVVWPLMVQARRGTPTEMLPHVDRTVNNKPDAAIADRIPYRSKVPGVDSLYLSGIYFYEQRTPDALNHSLQIFSEAIAKDPNYAPAYVGLATTYSLMREYSAMSDTEAYPKAKAAAEHAIELDPKLPQAHASLGFIDFFWSWDAAAAEKQFQTAIALDPSSVLAHHWYGSMLAHQGRFAEALQQLDIAQRLEPTSAAIVSLKALALGFSGHRDDAVAMLQTMVKAAPSATSTHNVLGSLSLIEPRNIPLYLDETRQVAELRHDEEWMRMNKAAERAYRSGGEMAMWKSMLEFDRQLHPVEASELYPIAEAEAVLGHTDDSFAILDRLIEQHNPIAMGLHNDPTLKSLHRDPRFTQLETKMACPPLPTDR